MEYVFRKKRYQLLARLVDTIGPLFFRSRAFERGGDYRNILVIRLDHLGDVLASVATAKVLRGHWPKARVTFLTGEWGAALLEGNPFVDETIVFNAPWFSKGRYPGGIRRSPADLLKILRDRKFDLAISLRGDLRENLLMARAGIPERVGFGETGGRFLLTKEILYQQGVHHTERSRRLLEAIGIPRPDLTPKIYFSPEETAAFDRKLAGLNWAEGKHVGIQLEAGSPAKNWTKAKAAEFLERLGQRLPDYKIVLVGNSEAEIFPAKEGQLLDLRKKTTVRELGLLLRKLDAFVGPDSGPSHLAAALGVPTVFLYSGTNVFEEWKPLAENAVALRRQVVCRPCQKRNYAVTHPCMAFEPTEVLSALERSLGR